MAGASASMAAISRRCRSTGAAGSGWRARSRSPRCFPISPRSTMSRWRSRRMPAIRSASGATPGASRALREPARAALDRVGLAAARRRSVADLSHGERRQLEIAMALATEPRMLLLDEPMAGMGPEESARLVETLRQLKGSVTILLIEHDMDAVFALADRITVLVYGRIIASGDAGRDQGRRRRCAKPISATARTRQGRPWLTCAAARTCRRRDQLRAQPRAVRRVARGRARRNGVADGPQRHGQDHDRALDHGAHAGRGGLDPVRRRGNPRACPPIAWPSSASAWCRRDARYFPISPCAKISSPPPPIAALPPIRGRSKKSAALFPRLAERAASMANLLSGGEQQMLAIGRALMTNPRLLILDEATEGLAPLIRDEIWRCLRKLARGRPIDPGDRQERRCADPHRRPPLHHRTRPRGVVGRFRGSGQ